MYRIAEKMPIYSYNLSASTGSSPTLYQDAAPGPRWGSSTPDHIRTLPLLNTELRSWTKLFKSIA